MRLRDSQLVTSCRSRHYNEDEDQCSCSTRWVSGYTSTYSCQTVRSRPYPEWDKGQLQLNILDGASQIIGANMTIYTYPSAALAQGGSKRRHVANADIAGEADSSVASMTLAEAVLDNAITKLTVDVTADLRVLVGTADIRLLALRAVDILPAKCAPANVVCFLHDVVLKARKSASSRVPTVAPSGRAAVEHLRGDNDMLFCPLSSTKAEYTRVRLSRLSVEHPRQNGMLVVHTGVLVDTRAHAPFPFSFHKDTNESGASADSMENAAGEIPCTSLPPWEGQIWPVNGVTMCDSPLIPEDQKCTVRILSRAQYNPQTARLLPPLL